MYTIYYIMYICIHINYWRHNTSGPILQFWANLCKCFRCLAMTPNFLWSSKVKGKNIIYSVFIHWKWSLKHRIRFMLKFFCSKSKIELHDVYKYVYYFYRLIRKFYICTMEIIHSKLRVFFLLWMNDIASCLIRRSGGRGVWGLPQVHQEDRGYCRCKLLQAF